jgi:RNA polymerase sigma factor (sigma-70 family)
LDSVVLTDQFGVDDVGELYARLSGPLERIVRLDVRAPDAVIEDACQVAWSRLVDHRTRVRREAALSWLAKTAVREAFKLIRREDRELSLDAVLELAGDGVLPSSSPGPEQLFECWALLESVRALPERQQRMLWLHMLGLSYAEMAQHEGCTERTVERQLLRAKRALRAAVSEA